MWKPGVPAGISNQVVQWAFDGDYVNDHTNAVPNGSPPSSSENYFLNTNLLSCITATNWWVSGASSWPGSQYAATVSEKLTFANGQKAELSRSGLFAMHRPTLVNWTQIGQAIVTNYTGIPDVTEAVGVGTAKGKDAMAFTTKVISAYAGVAIFTQVYDDQSYPTAYGSNVLDGAEIYQHEGLIPVSTNAAGARNTITFDDQPSEESDYFGTFVSLVVQFRDYVRFMPTNGAPNIYITLGKVTWSVDAVAIKPYDDWVLLPGNPVVPTWGPSQEFPYWTNVGLGQ